MGAQVKLLKTPIYTPETDGTRVKISQIANMSDRDILLSSAKKTEYDTNKSLTAKLNKALFPATVGSFVLTDIIKYKIKEGNVIKNAPPSYKIAAGIASLASWLLLIKSFDIAGNISQKFAQKTDNKDLQSGAVLAGTIGGGFALNAGITKLIDTGIKKISKTMPEATAELKQKAKVFDTKFLANGFVKKINKHVLEPLKAFGKKHPNLTNFASKNARLLILGGYVLGTILLGIKLRNDKEKAFENNVDKMLETREEAKMASGIF